MSNKPSIAVRDYIPEDRHFVLATFLRGLYYGDSWFSVIPKNVFMAVYHTVIENLMAKPGVYIKVSCLKEDPDVILGYAILGDEGRTIHWIFTKSAWRGIGIAKSLAPEGAKVATHLTRSGLAILKKRSNMIFNPFI